jgi:hypothetical protein
MTKQFPLALPSIFAFRTPCTISVSLKACIWSSFFVPGILSPFACRSFSYRYVQEQSDIYVHQKLVRGSLLQRPLASFMLVFHVVQSPLPCRTITTSMSYNHHCHEKSVPSVLDVL